MSMKGVCSRIIIDSFFINIVIYKQNPIVFNRDAGILYVFASLIILVYEQGYD